MIALLVPLVGIVGLFYSFTLYRESLADVADDSDATSHRTDYQVHSKRKALDFGGSILRTLWVVVLSAYLFLHFVVGFETAVSYLLGAGCALAVAVVSHFVGFVETNQNDQNNVNRHKSHMVAGLATTSIALVGLGILYFAFDSMATIQSLLGFGLGGSQSVLLLSFCANPFLNQQEQQRSIASKVGGSVLLSSQVVASYLAVILAIMLMGRAIVLEDGAQFVFVQTPFVLAVLGLVASIIGFHLGDGVDSEEGSTNRLAKAMRLATGIFILESLFYSGFCWLFFGTLGLWHWLAITAGALTFVGMGRGNVGVSAGEFSSSRCLWCPPFTFCGCSILRSCKWRSGDQSLLTLLIVVMVASWCGGELEGLYCVGLALIGSLACCPLLVAERLSKNDEENDDCQGRIFLHSSILVVPLIAMLLTFLLTKQSFQLIQTLGHFSWLQIVVGLLSSIVGLQLVGAGLVMPVLENYRGSMTSKEHEDVAIEQLAGSDEVGGRAELLRGRKGRSVREAGRLLGLFGMLIPLCVATTFGGDVLTGQLLGLLAVVAFFCSGLSSVTQSQLSSFSVGIVASFSLVFFFVTLLSLPLIA